ncbi:hypothetical protein A3F37_02680 [Candidatus Saccharibacteria bacterium RIFCSPHIGHO2_12_FULL_41_12]|nr:MAG: hypothetical protein A3F37_02680 [Candidatus Saccharibacteria bacterium RIFCSPHIGHO2_12_FULL_41_12]
MKQPVNFICTPECEASLAESDLSVRAKLLTVGERQANAIGNTLLGSYRGEVNLFTSPSSGALVATKAIAVAAKIPGHSISSLLDKNSTRGDFEVDGKVEVLGLDEVGLPAYTRLDMERMLNFYNMVVKDPFNRPTYAVTEKDSIWALLGALKIKNHVSEIKPGTITSITSITDIAGVGVVATTIQAEFPDAQDAPETLAA